MPTPFSRIASDVAKEQNDELSRLKRLGIDPFWGIEEERRYKQRHPIRWGRMGWLLIAVALGCTIAAWLRLRPNIDLVRSSATGTASENWSEIPRAGRWVTSAGDESALVLFSDEAVVKVSSKSSLRLISSDYFGANLAVEGGSISIRVDGTWMTEYHLGVGPFDITMSRADVRVTWDPMIEELNLVVYEGRATVAGCQFGVGRAIQARKTMVLHCLVP